MSRNLACVLTWPALLMLAARAASAIAPAPLAAPVPALVPAQSLPPVITLSVDATQAPRKLLHSRETIAVKAGPLTLLYPKWIPGEHGPTGPVADVVGPAAHRRRDATLPWRRDLIEMYALHCDVPAGAGALEVVFDFLCRRRRAASRRAPPRRRSWLV